MIIILKDKTTDSIKQSIIKAWKGGYVNSGILSYIDELERRGVDKLMLTVNQVKTNRKGKLVKTKKNIMFLLKIINRTVHK